MENLAPPLILKWLAQGASLAFFGGIVGFMVFAFCTGPAHFGYNLRNVLVRWRSTLATILGVALVVAVYVCVQAMAAGIEKSSGSTGDPRNLLVVRKGSTAESSSLITLEQFRSLRYAPEIARGADGEPLLSTEILVLLNLPRRDGAGEANVLLRGTTPAGRALRDETERDGRLRPQVRLTAGRWFVPGRREVVVSQRLAARFANFEVGGQFKSGPATFTVVGHFDGAKTAFDSEVWMDADETRAIFDRDQYSSLLLRPTGPEAATNLIRRLEQDRRLQLLAEPEAAYYARQTATAAPIKWLGNALAVAMSVGAVFAAMNTMYAAVGARTREIGTLRVLGFRRRTVVAGFLLEGALLALIGGVIGCAFAFLLNGYAVGTINFETFSETVFEFRVTPALVARGLVFSILVGLAGTLLPALRASRLPVIAALKSL